MATGNIGPVVRANNKPRLVVLRGHSLQEPSSVTEGHKVAPGVTIYSGQLIEARTRADGSRDWVLFGSTLTGDNSAANLAPDDNPVPFFAQQDSEDFDVQASQRLIGLPCSAPFKLRTAYFKTTDTYSGGVSLVADEATPGSIRAGTGASPDGQVLGYVADGGVVSLVGKDSTFKPTGTDALVLTTSFSKIAP